MKVFEELDYYEFKKYVENSKKIDTIYKNDYKFFVKNQKRNMKKYTKEEKKY